MQTIVIAVAVSIGGLLAGPGTTRPSPANDAVSRTDFVRKAIAENLASDQQLLAEVVALGPDIASEVEPYLRHSDPQARRNALEVLAKIPGIGARVVKEALASKDPVLEGSAVYVARGLLSDPEVADAYVECLMARRGTDVVQHARDHVLPTLVPAERKAVLERLIPRIVRALPELFSESDRAYEGDCQWAETLLLVLGQYAEYGDAAVLTAITEVRARADAALPGGQTEADFVELCRQKQERVHEAVLFSQASLGDATAWAKYSNDALNGTPETKLSRLKRLSRLQPTERVLELTIRLLDDKTKVRVYPDFPEYRRTCDLALDALGGWCNELKPLARTHTIYDDKHLARARQVARSYIVRMQASFGPPNERKTIFDLPVTASRPETQPTSRPTRRPPTRPTTEPDHGRP